MRPLLHEVLDGRGFHESFMYLLNLNKKRFTDNLAIQRVTYFLNEMAEIVSLLAQRLSRQTVHECHHAVWEVMSGKPTDNHSLLHVRSSCYIEYQIAKLMPVPSTQQITHSQAIQALTSMNK